MHIIQAILVGLAAIIGVVGLVLLWVVALVFGFTWVADRVEDRVGVPTIERVASIVGIIVLLLWAWYVGNELLTKGLR